MFNRRLRKIRPLTCAKIIELCESRERDRADNDRDDEQNPGVIKFNQSKWPFSQIYLCE